MPVMRDSENPAVEARAVKVLENFQAVAIQRIAHDLASLLQRAVETGVCICPDVDDEGITYSIEGQFGDADVEWDDKTKQWIVTKI